MNENVFVMDHPLIQHKLSILRDEKTGSKQFRELISEIAMLMCYESTRDLPLREVETKTPITVAKTKVLAGRNGVCSDTPCGARYGGRRFKPYSRRKGRSYRYVPRP